MKIVISLVLIWCFIWLYFGKCFFKKSFDNIIKKDLYDDINWTTKIILTMTIIAGYIMVMRIL